MANWKFKTRDNGNPQGKPNVFFCSHPEDFDSVFERISNEVLELQNCAIWYTNEEIVKDEEFCFDLKQMQLFVIPVTFKLLSTKNDALDFYFKFAVENKIPVLPIMLEGGLEALFNEEFGDLQFLDINNADTTAISFSEKLKKYLESVLIGDELSEKIRSAFDAYVFLSYRKKDRKYAQELMSLIHKNDFCRDIAIWYDEFLTPGENFNDSIKSAIQKSDLFVLTVTPNLVNEKNYVMKVEYPMAKEEGKPILPAEILPTDRNKLFEMYEGISEPTNAHSEKELSKALLDALNKIAIKENDNSPEHNFFIGLAYLGGVDVEVNFERALKLITSAAEGGVLEAYEKLVTMYKTGHGVERNYYTATKLQEKLAERYYSVYCENPNEYYASYASLAYMDLGDCYSDLNMYKEAEVAYKKMYDISKFHAENAEQLETNENYNFALKKLCLLKIEVGDYKEAQKYAEEALAFAKTIYDENDTMLVTYISDLGLTYFYQLKHHEAIEKFEMAVEILKNNKEDDEIFDRIIYANVCSNLASCLKMLLKLDESLYYQEEAIKVIEGVNKETQNLYLENYCYYAIGIGETLVLAKQSSKALEILNNAYGLLFTEYSERPLPSLVKILGNLQTLIGRCYLDVSKRDEAEKSFRTAIEWYKTNEELFKADIGLDYNNIGVLYLNEGNYQGAYENLVIAYNIYEELSEKEQTWLRYKAITGYNLGIISYNLNKKEESLDYMLKSFELYKYLIKLGEKIHIETFKSVIKDVVFIYNEKGKTDQALQFDAMAKEFIEKNI